MQKPLKNITAKLLIVLWISFFGVCFAEAMGYCHDDDEYTDQSIESVFSIPAEAATSFSHHLLGCPFNFNELKPTCFEVSSFFQNDLQARPFHPPFDGSPPGLERELFLQFSNLRI